jgi:flagellin-like hook-associated protein FlgL
VLSLRARSNATERYTDAIEGGKRALDTGASALEQAGNLVSEARALSLQAINGISSPEDRRLIAGQLREIKTQLLDLANSQSGGRYLFSGTASDMAPFASSDHHGLSRTSYNGNRDQHQLLVGAEMRITTGLAGSDVFSAGAPAGAHFAGLTGAALGSSPNQGQGAQFLHVRHDSSVLTMSGGITLAVGGANDNVIGAHTISVDSAAGTVTLDGGPARALPSSGAANWADFELTNSQGDSVHLDFSTWNGASTSGTVQGTGSISLDGTNWTPLDGVSSDLALSDAASGVLLHVDVRAIHRAGDELVSFSGTVNIFDTLEAIAVSLENSAGLSAAQQVDQVKLVFDELDRNHDNLLAGLSTLGARSARLSNLGESYDNAQTQLAGQISLIEDADYSKVVLDMTRAEQTLQLTQAVGTRLLQTSLLNFLR